MSVCVWIVFIFSALSVKYGQMIRKYFNLAKRMIHFFLHEDPPEQEEEDEKNKSERVMAI